MRPEALGDVPEDAHRMPTDRRRPGAPIRHIGVRPMSRTMPSSSDRSGVAALQENEDAKFTRYVGAYKSGLFDRDETRVALGKESNPEYIGQFAAPAPDPNADPTAPPPAKSIKSEWNEADHPRDPNGEFGAGGDKSHWAKGPESGAVDRAAVRGEMRPAAPEEKKLHKVPPAYTNVQVTDDPKAEIRATAKTPNGKTKDYATASYNKNQSDAKFDRVARLHTDLPKASGKWDKEIAAHGPNENEALVLKLISQTGFRTGGAVNKAKPAYGANTLLTSHAVVTGDKIDFDFIGKSGKRQQHSLTDPVLARHIEARQAAGKATLFDTSDKKTLGYMKSTAGNDYKVHDLRTHVASAMAGDLVSRSVMPTDDKARAKLKISIADSVAKKIGDTRKVALDRYIHPHTWDGLEGGK